MRLFIAVNFTSESKKEIIEIQNKLRFFCTRGNFTKEENLHLTLAFLGETKEEKLNTLFKIMDEIKYPPFEILFNSTGCFIHSFKELWWIGIDKKNSGFTTLEKIHKQLTNALKQENFNVDLRPFNAHITLGREIKHSSPIVLKKPEVFISVTRISLMVSERINGKLTYTEIHNKKLLKELL